MLSMRTITNPSGEAFEEPGGNPFRCRHNSCVSSAKHVRYPAGRTLLQTLDGDDPNRSRSKPRVHQMLKRYMQETELIRINESEAACQAMTRCLAVSGLLDLHLTRRTRSRTRKGGVGERESLDHSLLESTESVIRTTGRCYGSWSLFDEETSKMETRLVNL